MRTVPNIRTHTLDEWSTEYPNDADVRSCQKPNSIIATMQQHKKERILQKKDRTEANIISFLSIHVVDMRIVRPTSVAAVHQPRALIMQSNRRCRRGSMIAK